MTGTHVHENGDYFTGQPPQAFTLRVYTSGAVRYVDHTELDQVGYLRYAVSGVTWEARRELEIDTRPELDDLEGTGRFLNQQTNWGSYWELERDVDDDEVSGSCGSTRSPVDYHANGAGREAILLLPVEYWPDRDKRFRVRNAVRVNEDGTDSTDLRRVDFLRFTVDLAWEARFARVQVPTAPRALEAEDVQDGSLELDWRSPQDDGAADIEGYGIQCWDGDDEEWDTEEADTDDDDTDYAVRRLDPHTRYSYRVQRQQGRGSWSIVDPDTGSGVTHCVDRQVAVSTSYNYQVQALNYGEPGEMSSARSITTTAARTVPGSPTVLAVAPGTDSQLQLTWTAPSDTGGGVTGYQVERAPDEMPRVWTEVVADTGTAEPTWAEVGQAGTGIALQGDVLRVPQVGMPALRAGHSCSPTGLPPHGPPATPRGPDAKLDPRQAPTQTPATG